MAYARDAYDAASGADALLVLTDWEEFGQVDLKIVRTKLHYPIVVDGRNVFSPEVMAEAGLIYYSVGRLPVNARRMAASSVGRAS